MGGKTGSCRRKTRHVKKKPSGKTFESGTLEWMGVRRKQRSFSGFCHFVLDFFVLFLAQFCFSCFGLNIDFANVPEERERERPMRSIYVPCLFAEFQLQSPTPLSFSAFFPPSFFPLFLSPSLLSSSMICGYPQSV